MKYKIEYIKQREEFLLTWKDGSESICENIDDIFNLIKKDFEENT